MPPLESKPTQHHRQAAGPGGDDASAEVQSEWSETVRVGEQVLDCLVGIVELARLEALLAVKTLPRALGLWLLLLPLVFLTWISFSLLISWIAYEYFMAAIWGFITFFLLQCMALGGCYSVFGVYKRRLSLPHTRKHVASAIRSVQHEFEAARKEQ